MTVAIGDITHTSLGIFKADDSTGINAVMNAENVGMGATVGSDTTSFEKIYVGAGQIAIFKTVRAIEEVA